MAESPLEGSPAKRESLRLVSVQPRWEPWRRRAVKSFYAGFITIAVMIGLGLLTVLFHWDPPATLGKVFATGGCGLTTAFFLFGAIAGVASLVTMVGTPAEERGVWPVLVALGPVLAGLVFTLFGFVATWMSVFGFARGRQIRKRGKVQLAPLVEGDDWSRLALLPRAPDELRGQLADRWRENGRTEHASVAAFARLALDLMALGAPARLLEDANRDSLDEIRHADLCFSLARALDGKSESPARFPAVRGSRTAFRSFALARLAVDSLIDGALHEGLSARVLARLAKRCEDPAARSVVLELARDEGRHAAHGWDVVEWCLSEGGAPVAKALLGSLRAIPSHPASDIPEAARAGAWEAYGLHGEALEAEEHAKARVDVVMKVRKLAATVTA